jgi:hypothetical protein
MAFGCRVEARTLNRRRVGASCEGQSTTNTCAVHGEALYLRSIRARERNVERRKPVQLPCLTVTSDERPHVEGREKRVAVHRAEWEIRGCVDEIGRIHDELPEGG